MTLARQLSFGALLRALLCAACAAESSTLMLTLADAAADHQGVMAGSATVGDVSVAVHDGGTRSDLHESDPSVQSHADTDGPGIGGVRVAA